MCVKPEEAIKKIAVVSINYSCVVLLTREKSRWTHKSLLRLDIANVTRILGWSLYWPLQGHFEASIVITYQWIIVCSYSLKNALKVAPT